MSDDTSTLPDWHLTRPGQHLTRPGQHLDEHGQHLAQELDQQRRRVGRHQWRCSQNLRARVVVYAGACRTGGESDRRLATRLGLTQATISRWMREAGAAENGFRQIAIIPFERTCDPVLPAPLRLITPRGFVVEGLDWEGAVAFVRALE